ncbi:hypothetical protein D3C71_1494570 [compost metagenome]
MASAGHECREGNKLATDNDRTAEGQTPFLIDEGLERCRVHHAERPRSRDQQLRAGRLAGTGRDQDAGCLHGEAAVRAGDCELAVVPGMDHAMLRENSHSDGDGFGDETARIGGSGQDAAEFTHAEGWVPAMAGDAACLRHPLEDDDIGHALPFQFYGGGKPCRPGADNGNVAVGFTHHAVSGAIGTERRPSDRLARRARQLNP